MSSQVKPRLGTFVAPGSAKYSVSYTPYDPHWAEAFDDVADLVRKCVGRLPMEHVGSTAVKGLGGRGALDVAVIAPSAEHAAARSSLLHCGFRAAPFEHYLPLLVAKLVNRHGEFPVLLYVVDPGSQVLRDWLTLRNYLRKHGDEAAAYDAAKQIAAKAGDGDAYQRAKTPCIQQLVQRAGQHE